MVAPMQARRAVPLALAVVLAAGLLVVRCLGSPAGLWIGDCLLPRAELEAAEAELAVAFAQEGEATRRWHLLEFGMGPAALLHHALPDASAAALEEAEPWAERLEEAEDRMQMVRDWRAAAGLMPDEAYYVQPNPAALGSRVAAAVAPLDRGGIAGPLRTAEGWEIVLLAGRSDGVRNRANVLVYRMVFPVGDATDRERARSDWGKLPLSGDPDLLDALPLEFRRDRVTDPQ